MPESDARSVHPLLHNLDAINHTNKHFSKCTPFRSKVVEISHCPNSSEPSTVTCTNTGTHARTHPTSRNSTSAYVPQAVVQGFRARARRRFAPKRRQRWVLLHRRLKVRRVQHRPGFQSRTGAPIAARAAELHGVGASWVGGGHGGWRESSGGGGGGIHLVQPVLPTPHRCTCLLVSARRYSVIAAPLPVHVYPSYRCSASPISTRCTRQSSRQKEGTEITHFFLSFFLFLLLSLPSAPFRFQIFGAESQ